MFNKAHSAEYAVEAFQGAWLKRRFPAHYLAAILSNYRGESPGVLNNLARMLNHGTLAGTGKLVILPVDQGVEHGPER